MIRFIYLWVKSMGIDLRQLINFLPNLCCYIADYFKLKSQKGGTFRLSPTHPCLHDRGESSGVASGHYFHQDLYVAQKIFEDRPNRHVDVGSSVESFVAHVAAFREIEVFDIRKLECKTNNILFKQLDLMKLTEEFNECTDSISCLHALEHFGLGRYGDTLDINGYVSGFENISKMLNC